MGRSLRASFALDSAQVPKRRPLRRRWRRTLRNRGVLFGYFFPRPLSGDSLACSHVWLGLRVVPSRHRGALRPPTPGRASVPATMTSVASKPRLAEATSLQGLARQFPACASTLFFEVRISLTADSCGVSWSTHRRPFSPSPGLTCSSHGFRRPRPVLSRGSNRGLQRVCFSGKSKNDCPSPCLNQHLGKGAGRRASADGGAERRLATRCPRSITGPSRDRLRPS